MGKPKWDRLKASYLDVPATSIAPNPWNPNVLTATIRRKLKENIAREGFVDPVTVARDRDGYVILDGEQRFTVGKELGMKAFPCIVLEESDGKPMPPERMRLLTLNLNHLRGEDDPVKLSALIDDLSKTLDVAVLADMTVFNVEQLKALRVFNLDKETLAALADPEAEDDGLLVWAVHLSSAQLKVVDRAMSRVGAKTKAERLVRMCEEYLRPAK